LCCVSLSRLGRTLQRPPSRLSLGWYIADGSALLEAAAVEGVPSARCSGTSPRWADRARNQTSCKPFRDLGTALPFASWTRYCKPARASRSVAIAGTELRNSCRCRDGRSSAAAVDDRAQPDRELAKAESVASWLAKACSLGTITLENRVEVHEAHRQKSQGRRSGSRATACAGKGRREEGLRVGTLERGQSAGKGFSASRLVYCILGHLRFAEDGVVRGGQRRSSRARVATWFFAKSIETSSRSFLVVKVAYLAPGPVFLYNRKRDDEADSICDQRETIMRSLTATPVRGVGSWWLAEARGGD